jgi:hypothetical protein
LNTAIALASDRQNVATQLDVDDRLVDVNEVAAHSVHFDYATLKRRLPDGRHYDRTRHQGPR